ncbi:LytR/AlgR family response regulator transcription factor [Formosa algae]|uniref:DNA-binding LytR/AlgR family response regulator n=1 Tax=Formosa algae TaxID=225843 RepID=A0A9X0YLX0_9FLAO|nr:response regulator [Formosa algae]MBP1841192.1 DNA-binding LytR/AlgR family response regulator [Formosa algae]MDQ0336388.1 DNA-binding LytR/AlgR family response regulator [Formosa algae]OEI81354.1 DNA-binding response regulator [Formosa algae]
MKCIIIDDEPLAIDIVESYLNQIGGIDIIAKCTNPLEAITQLNKQHVDLVFLDIEMPNLSGIDLVKSIENLPQFIFTTAYPQYALDGFNLNATDYLVKPIPFHRFIKAVARAKEKYELLNLKPAIATPNAETNILKPENDFIFVKSEYENIKIKTEEITYIQGLKDYIKIHIEGTNKAVITLLSFKDMLEKLPRNNHFLRVHKSFIVNVNAIRALQKTKIVLQNDMRIPIGETFKKEVLERLGV